MAIVILNDNGVFRADDDDEDVEAYRDLWLLYHFYFAAVSNSAMLAANPDEVFKGGRAN